MRGESGLNIVLVLTNFSKPSENAITKAIYTLQGAERFLLVTIIPSTYSHFWNHPNTEVDKIAIGKTSEKLGDFLSSIKIPITNKIKVEIMEGDPLEKLLELSNDNMADVIVLQYPGGFRLRDLAARNLAKKVISRSRVPIMVVN